MLMKKYWILLACSLCLLSCTHRSSVSFTTIEGKTITLVPSDHRWVLINYWASWCHPCLQEIPKLNALSKDNTTQLLVLGINYDALPLSEQQQFAKAHRVNYPLLTQDIGAFFKLPPVSVLPTSYLIDPDGKLAATLQGPQALMSLKKFMPTLVLSSELAP